MRHFTLQLSRVQIRAAVCEERKRKRCQTTIILLQITTDATTLLYSRTDFRLPLSRAAAEGEKQEA